MSKQANQQSPDHVDVVLSADALFRRTYRPGEAVDAYVARLARSGESPVTLAVCRQKANDAFWQANSY